MNASPIPSKMVSSESQPSGILKTTMSTELSSQNMISQLKSKENSYLTRKNISRYMIQTSLLTLWSEKMLLIIRKYPIMRDYRLISLLDYLQKCEVGYEQEFDYSNTHEEEGVYGKDEGYWVFVGMDEIFKNEVINPSKFIPLIYPRPFLRKQEEPENFPQSTPSYCRPTC